MSHFRLARISLILAAIGLNATPALLSSAHAQAKPDPAAEAAAAAKAKENYVRPEMFKLIDSAKNSELMAQKNFAQVKANLAAAELIPNRTPFENYIIEHTRYVVAVRTEDDATARKSAEALLATGRLDKKASSELVLNLGTYQFKAKEYAAAAATFKRYQAESDTPAKATDLLARSHFFNKDYAAANALIVPMVAEAEAAGKAPDQVQLRLMTEGERLLKNTPAFLAGLEKLVTYYPSTETWAQLLSRLHNKPGLDDRLRLDIFRLEMNVQDEMQAVEYIEMAELALMKGFPSEAKKAMDAGYANSVLVKDEGAAKHKLVRDRVNKAAAEEVKTIASQDASVLKAKDGLPVEKLGYAYVTMDQFDKGIELMEKGLAKGGFKKVDDSKLRLGVAYAKAGRKADAIKVFEGLKGNDGMTELARYWIIYLNGAKGAAPAAGK
ncbi:MAG: hypothetical protein V4633_13920 [Pseudomonadota bacterium]